MSLYELEDFWAGCQRCDLHKTRANLVFGEGNPEADILIIGEGPGEREDQSGHPFYGRAGEVLDEFLDLVSLDRAQDLYLTNVVCCRPTVEVTDDRTGQTRTDNRPPSKLEREACRPRLMETTYLIDPLIIITVGKVPFQVLTGKATQAKAARGRMCTFTMMGRIASINYAVLPIYHTAYLARSHDRRREGPWGETLEDFNTAVKLLDHLREAYRGVPKPNRKEMFDARHAKRR